MGAGSLTVVGTGIGGCGQITFESSSIIKTSEKVLFLTDNPLTGDWIRKANPTSESLFPIYAGRPNRLQTYLDMTEHILSFVRRKLAVCAVFYGHPGVFVFPSHEAVIRAREEGFEARMLPAISAEDCLFSDLGVDPGRRGCQSFDATDFLVRKRQTDIRVPLVLWQIGSLGRIDCPSDHANRNIPLLAEQLQRRYGPQHEVVIYEAAQYPVCDPVIEFVPLDRLADAEVTPISTLYVPPKEEALIDYEMAHRLGIPKDYLVNIKDSPSRYSASRPYASPKPRLP
jgi:uncharacterized protein YabN with tetrapyrrole methylase and pyrophosphatase domain